MLREVPAAGVPDNVWLLDVREHDEWIAGHAPGATHIPLGELSARAAEIPQDQDGWGAARADTAGRPWATGQTASARTWGTRRRAGTSDARRAPGAPHRTAAPSSAGTSGERQAAGRSRPSDGNARVGRVAPAGCRRQPG